MQALCDLHTHSTFSDGSLTPAELIDAAVAEGLSAMALCDHNTVSGLPQLMEAASGKPITAVAGAEFSVGFEGREVHLLGLFIPESSFARVQEQMVLENSKKEARNLQLIQSLKRVGISLDYDAIKAKSERGLINRAHIALAMVEGGYVGSTREAFDSFLSPGAGHYTEPERINVLDMIEFVRSVGALPVLAHPFLNLSPEQLERFLPLAVERGLAGMECLYSTYDAATEQMAFEMASRHGLCPSGGSDFHGVVKPDIRLGTGMGNLKIPFAWCEALRACL